VFSRTDLVTDSEQFYNSILELFDDIDEHMEIDHLFVWWNRYNLNMVTVYSPDNFIDKSFRLILLCPIAVNSALARIKAKRALKKAAVQQSLEQQAY